ncbi:MAG: P1 family peptidase, partial [Serratia inhibens]|uniref:P1 family peptidase n=2 Tax=Serratia TaxID=613 RepID=UPI003C7BE4EB
DALGEDNLVQTVDALVLSGGSVYGLAAADGVAAWLGQQGRGYALRPAPGVPVSPIVPTACLYDLNNAGDKNWQLDPPYRQLGIEAAGKAGHDFPLGTVGAGYGAMTGMGKLKGGLGSASIVAANGATVGALVAVNSLGSVVAPGTRAFWATPYEINGEFGNGGAAALAQLHGQGEDWMPTEPTGGRKNTTLACIATDLALTRVELKRVAIMAQDGMARAIRPLHSPFDGDVVFALSTGKREVQGSRELAVLQIGALAADTLARAIARGVYAATPWPGSQVTTWKTLA